MIHPGIRSLKDIVQRHARFMADVKHWHAADRNGTQRRTKTIEALKKGKYTVEIVQTVLKVRQARLS